ncbi:MAG: hypothetical protein GTO53_04455 [Planctomycetales bacterium]|nr:hypothetical protein [Planctomycetales bacterium]NIM08408.1 hypothetical protein [Planctomycetales bacterium]NIN07883.1 hypothetical protein [Planctomycetales bacterium]NIN77013.1 hypothetical protein [Planctomycetales bacterium]NIO34196.1 hypothetical protein [Planctomycetales bacterium]
MSDQATPLYQLARKVAPPQSCQAARQRLIVVTGAAAGVGTTLLTVQLARVWATTGQAVAVVDADPLRPAATRHFGLEPTGQVWELFRGLLSVDECVTRVSPEVCLVPGGRPSAIDWFGSQTGRAEVLQSLQQLRSRFAWTVVDAGAGDGAIVGDICQTADITLLVADDRSSPMDAYAAVKRLARSYPGFDASRPIALILNRVLAHRDSEAAQQCLLNTARRFLNIPIQPAGYVYENEDPRSVLAKFVQSLDAVRTSAEPEKKIYAHSIRSVPGPIDQLDTGVHSHVKLR